jgi:hypothetical protein
MAYEEQINLLRKTLRNYIRALEFAIENGRYADEWKSHLTRGDWGNELRKIAEEGKQ